MSQGKPITQGSRLVAFAIDKATKNALADIVLDRIKLAIGEEATDERILQELQVWFDPIARVRGDARIDFVAVGKRRVANDDRYRAAFAKSE